MLNPVVTNATRQTHKPTRSPVAPGRRFMAWNRWLHRGANAAQGASDAIRRVALGLGLAIWFSVPVDAAVIGPQVISPSPGPAAVQPVTGRRLLKAQKNALNAGLGNLRQ